MEVDKKTLEAIIVEDNTEKLVAEAEKLGKYLSKDLSTSQIRVIYGTVKKVSQVWTPQSSAEDGKSAYHQILLLKPKLAYQEGRAKNQQKDAIHTMRTVVDQCVNLIDGKVEKFKRFAEFFEAILAYHRAYGGR